MTLPRSRLTSPFRFFIATSAAIFLASCLSDGPDQTGLGYIQSGGVELTVPLHHLVISDFPVEADSIFATELPLNHFGEIRLLVGRDGPFTSSVRMGFQITTAVQHHGIDTGLNLRMAVLPINEIGYSYLQSSTAKCDSLTLLVESLAWNIAAGTTYNDSLALFHRRFIATQTPFSTQNPANRVKDTLRIALKGAYVALSPDSLQIDSLPNLRKTLATDTLNHWLVFLEISPLKNAVDSGMFRFIGYGGSTYSSYNPGLLMGSATRNAALSASNFIGPYFSGIYPGVNYQVKHSGTDKSLLYGVSRGLNLRLNRNTLLSRIRDSLKKIDPLLDAKYFSSLPGKFDTRFYVPYAEIHFPLTDSLARVDGPFALDMQLRSDVDSQALNPTTGSSASRVPVPLNDSLKLVNAQSGNLSLDTLVCRYFPHPIDNSLRQLAVYWTASRTVQDTFLFTPDGKRQEIPLRRHTGWTRTGTLGVYPGDTSASVEVYFNIGYGVEPSGFIDTTGRPFTAFKGLARRYWRPGAATLQLRATRGLGALLNRTSGVNTDLFLSPVDQNAFFDTSYSKVLYPVLGEINFPKDASGKMKLTVDIYLYPLRSGQ